jgi:alkanesulfonate monooxygenase SsuD/methylene tetrahydromethanopterin reductase-like flavin-dependent oxidoreductase (luciferase family)
MAGGDGVKFGITACGVGELGDCALLAEIATEAENAGWDGFFVTDHVLYRTGSFIPVADPWIATAAIMSTTSSIWTGVLVSALPRRRPWLVAQHVIGLHQMGPGRVVLGVGLGSPVAADSRPFGEPEGFKERSERSTEALEVIHRLLRGQCVSYEGNFYQLRDVTLTPTGINIPIWHGASWPGEGMLRGAKWCDGFARAGASWALDYLGWRRGDLASLRRRVRAGPPR